MSLELGYLVPGLLLLALVVLDVLWTTISVEGGAGPLTSRLMVGTWRSLRWAVPERSPALVLCGPLAMVVTLGAWLLALWAGWTLVFGSTTLSLVDTVGASTVSWWDRIYFAGYAIFTLGNGDLAPAEGPWQVATTLATASGMFVVTLSVSYVLSVLGAVTQKRSFADTVSGLGTDGAEIVAASWDESSFAGLDDYLRTFATKLTTLTANHKAYPVLHYFHSRGAEQAPAATIAALDEALTLIAFAVEDDVRPPALVLRSARSSVSTFLTTLESAFVDPAQRAPPPPDLDRLREEGIPVVDDEAYRSALADLDLRRRMLLGMARSDAREWPV